MIPYFQVQEQMVPSAGFSPQSDPYESEYMHKFSHQIYATGIPPQQHQQQLGSQQQPEDSSTNFCSLADNFDLSLLGDHFDDHDMATVPSPSWSPAMSTEPTSWQQLSFYAASPSSDLNGFSPDIKPALSPDGSFIKAYRPTSPMATINKVEQGMGSENVGLDCANRNLLLRQCLEDTTFQRKYNFKPLELPSSSLFGEPDLASQQDMTSSPESSGLELNQIEPVFTMAFAQIRTDIQSACSSLAISSDPTQWSGQDVQKWLAHIFASFPSSVTMEDGNMDVTKAVSKFWNFDGLGLCALSEEEFKLHEPNYGYLIFHQLELWKMLRTNNKPCSAQLPQEVSFSTSDYDMEQMFNSPYAASPMQPTTVAENFEEPPSVVSDIVPTMVNSPSSSYSSPSAETDPANTDGTDEDEEEEEEESEKRPAAAGKSKGGNGQKSGAHIHLWQFLKELLASPQQHGSCIRWLDQSRGVFKIEDSVRVARLWGLRKNRPAMNYDKLSRSIRQYYRKGIMRKTERSQRLVYQFCHPYGL